MVILEDTRQQMQKHLLKSAQIEMAGHTLMRSKLVVGDYTSVGSTIFVDTKKDMYEIANNLCSSTREHERFARECLKAQEIGAKLIVLIENEGEWIGNQHNIWNPPVNCINDVYKWKNKRLFIFKNGQQAYPRAVKGSRLAKTMKTMQFKYGVEFRFCRPEEAGNVILDILMNEEKVESRYVRYRFKTSYTDPIEDMKAINMPYWHQMDDSEGNHIIVCYLPKGENILKYWDDAFDISDFEMDRIWYTDRFQKPDWIKDGD